MPGAERGVQPESEYKWIELSDLTAGIYNYSAIGGSDPNVPAPIGAAHADHTWACIALPQGGLGPLPKMVEDYAWPSSYNTIGITYVVGLLVHDDLFNGNTEAIIIGEYDNGTNHSWIASSFILETLADTAITSTTNASHATPSISGSPYPVMTRMGATAPTTTVGQPVVVFPVLGFASPAGIAGQVYVYPNPTTPTSFTPLGLITGASSAAGQIIANQNRIIVLGQHGFSYPAGSGFDTNEDINFTDPPNSTTLGLQQTTLVAEQPYGYGAMGSVSAGELFLVKKRGGGVVVTGDIFSPNVTYLPGVQPTGAIFGQSGSGMAGLFYCSMNNGAWMWNGGNTAVKVSTQLDDSFFLPSSFGTTAMVNYGFYCKCIGDKVYFSNNWVYDVRLGSWWRYYPTLANEGADLFWVQEVNGPEIYAAQLSFPQTNKKFMYKFDQNTPTTSYQWQGLPTVLTSDRMVELRQVIVRASTNAGNAACTVEVAVFQGTNLVGSVTTPTGKFGPAPSDIRLPIGSVNAGTIPWTASDLTIRIVASGGTGAAPNVHKVSLAYNQRQHLPTTGVGS